MSRPIIDTGTAGRRFGPRDRSGYHPRGGRKLYVTVVEIAAAANREIPTVAQATWRGNLRIPTRRGGRLTPDELLGLCMWIMEARARDKRSERLAERRARREAARAKRAGARAPKESER